MPSPDGIPPQDLEPGDVCTTSTGPTCNFVFTGYRIPMIVISPFTKKNYVSHTVADTTAALKFIETRFNLPPLTQRDAAAMDIGGVFSLSSPRKDNPLAKVKPPVNPNTDAIPDSPSHLQRVHAELASAIPAKGETQGVEHHDGMVPDFETGEEADDYIRQRYQNRKPIGPTKARKYKNR